MKKKCKHHIKTVRLFLSFLESSEYDEYIFDGETVYIEVFPQSILELLVPYAVDERVQCWRHH